MRGRLRGKKVLQSEEKYREMQANNFLEQARVNFDKGDYKASPEVKPPADDSLVDISIEDLPALKEYPFSGIKNVVLSKIECICEIEKALQEVRSKLLDEQTRLNKYIKNIDDLKSIVKSEIPKDKAVEKMREALQQLPKDLLLISDDAVRLKTPVFEEVGADLTRIGHNAQMLSIITSVQGIDSKATECYSTMFSEKKAEAAAAAHKVATASRSILLTRDINLFSC